MDIATNQAYSVTTRQFSKTLIATLALVGFGCLLHLVESGMLGIRDGFAENPVEVTIRSFGLAHFIIGWLFLASSDSIRNSTTLAKLFCAAICGAALCFLFSISGGLSNPLAHVLFYGYFVFHEFVDESKIHVAYGDAPPDRSPLIHITRSCSLIGLAVLTGGYWIYLVTLKNQSPSNRWVEAVLILSAVLVVLTALHLPITLKCCRDNYGSFRKAIQHHHSILIVFLTLTGLLTVAGPSGGLGFMVLVHVCAWIMFVTHTTGSRAQPSEPSLWSWVRKTPHGFVTLHIGVALCLLVIMAARVHYWGRSGIPSVVFSKDGFPFWALMHISISVVTKR